MIEEANDNGRTFVQNNANRMTPLFNDTFVADSISINKGTFIQNNTIGSE